MKYVKEITVIIFSSLVLLSLSLFFSYQRTIRIKPVPADVPETFATGGFPIKAFDYPFPALGTNEIPAKMLALFGLDFFIWLFVVVILWMIFPQLQKLLLKYYPVVVILGIISIIAGYLYLMIKFD